jgi:maltose alpha-D-glucosyltransferase / alpha-amylase
VIRDTPYPITLGPHTFFWLVLIPPVVPGVADGDRYLPNINFDGTPDWWRTVTGSRFVENDLRRYMRNCRWFRSKSREILNVTLADSAVLNPEEKSQLLMINFTFSEGAPDLYALPVKVVSGDEARSIEVEHPGAVIARIGHDGDLLVDATTSPAFHRVLLESIINHSLIPTRAGKLVASRPKRLDEVLDPKVLPASRVLKVEQSNSSILFENKVYAKLFRKLDEGLNPDLEVTKQLSEKCGFLNVPTYLGDLQYHARGQEPAALVVAQQFTSSEQDGWTHTLAAVDRYFDRVLADPNVAPPPVVGLWEQIPDELLTVIEGMHLENVRLLGERTAEMHLALAADRENPDFAPEPFTLQHQRSIFQSIRSETKSTTAILSKALRSIDEYARALAEQVLARAGDLSASHEYLLNYPIIVEKIRIHGDYHLGQVLFTGKDFVILDFEGEPARPLGERRLKRSALIDVAGMLRSFHYVAHYGLLESRTVRLFDRGVLEGYADLWSTRASQVFLSAYLDRASNASFLPREQDDVKRLLRSFSILKAMYELRYELNNRPRWIAIPLRGLLHCLDEIPAGHPTQAVANV